MKLEQLRPDGATVAAADIDRRLAVALAALKVHFP